MTQDEYREVIFALGLTPIKPSYEGATLHVDREGLITSVPDPEGLSPDERVAMIALIRTRLGIRQQ